MYEFKYTAAEMAELTLERAAKLREAKLDFILMDMERDIRNAASRGESELILSGSTHYIIISENGQPPSPCTDPERYCRKDYAHHFERAGYQIVVRNKRSYLTWAPKPEPMDD